MKSRFLFLALTVFLLTSALILPVSALKSGDPMGDVLYTNVVAYIDGYPIRSYNIEGYTYIVAEDLLEYGFHVEWDGVNSRLIIHEDRLATPDQYTTKYQPTANTGVPGMPAMKYLYTEVTTWIGDTQIEGYNIGGSTCIFMEELAAYFASDIVWDAPTSTLRMTSKFEKTPEIPDPTPETPTGLAGYEGFEAVPDLGAMTGLMPLMAPYADEASLTVIYGAQDILALSDLYGSPDELLDDYITLLGVGGFAVVDVYTDEECAVLYLANEQAGVGAAVGVYNVLDGYVSVECTKLNP